MCRSAKCNARMTFSSVFRIADESVSRAGIPRSVDVVDMPITYTPAEYRPKDLFVVFCDIAGVGIFCSVGIRRKTKSLQKICVAGSEWVSTASIVGGLLDYFR